MATVRIIVGGVVQAVSKVKALGAAAEQVQGPLATFGSRLPYAYGIETGRHRGGRKARAAGGAKMFEKGVAEATEYARQILPSAIVKGPTFIGAAKRKIRDKGIERIRAYTPVRSGNLRDSVSELNRPGIR